MQIDDATLFLSKFTKYPKNTDLYNVIPETYFEYQKECFNNGIQPYDLEDFSISFMVWFNRNILIKN